MSSVAPTVDALPTREAVMVQAPEENFSVALWLLGPRTRRHLEAIYGFARLADDVGDEVAGDRLALLDRIESELDAPVHPVMRALAATVRECALPRAPFLRLIEANRRDQVVTRYDTFEELLDYCQLSAAPIGELVLHVFGAATPLRVALSDKLCAGLQVIEHLQDVEEDRARGRVYIGNFDGIAHARALLREGAPLVGLLRGRARLAVAGFLAGGRLALEELEGLEQLEEFEERERPSARNARSAPSGTSRGWRFAAAYLRAVVGR
jgi:phytoene/squalene synthetase